MPIQAVEAPPSGASDAVEEGALLWTPSPAFVAGSGLARYTAWLAGNRGLTFSDYEALWRWSVTDLDAFWMSIWDYFEVISDARPTRVVSGEGMMGARWFEGSRTNYAEHLLRHEAQARPGQVALHHSSEIRPHATMSWQELGGKVRALASRLRELGLKPGDRVVSYMPNLPETAIAMMATVAVGAVWAAAAPEFGAATVVDRFEQIEPSLAFVADGYTFNGKTFDRRSEAARIAERLPSLKTVVWLDYLGTQGEIPGLANHAFAELVSGPAPSREDFRYERVANDHPLWILFSSGTTGRPKAIAHSHVGMLVEHLKVKALHVNIGPESCNYFYTTTGWMMWNSVLSSLITGASAVLFDGSPTFGGVDALWRIAEASRATVFGASPTLVQSMKRAGIRPGERYDLSAMDTIMVGGAPSTPEVFDWFYRNVKPDVWVTSTSGGTEICSAFVGGVPGRPVYAAEIQGRLLGMDVQAWDDDGRELIDQVGELVVLKPFPSMPLCFWNDEGDARYRDSYFSTYPGVWRHGDLIKINSRGGCYIYGRSDSTLNRYGVRIGSAEIYRVVENFPGVTDSLVICCELPGGDYYMPLFVSLQEGQTLTDEFMEGMRQALRREASPRHVPDEILQAPGVPYTLTGKKMEVPVRRIVMGAVPGSVASPDAMSNPAVLDWYVDFARRFQAGRGG